MIESASDAIQLLVVALCASSSLFRAYRTRSVAWLLLACFYGCMLFGSADWLVYQLVFGETPQYSPISDFSWTAGYVFLMMLEAQCDERRAPSPPVWAAWIPVVACAACCIFFIVTHGDPLLNLVENGMLAAVGFFAVRGLASDGGDGLAYNRLFHAATLAFVLAEEAVWLSSCFLGPGEIAATDPYIVFGYAMSFSMAAIVACAWRSNDL